MAQTIPTMDKPSLSISGRDGVEIRHFRLNHPKNYLAVPLTIAADKSTDALIREYAVDLPGEAQHEAHELGLIDEENDLTELGEAAVATADRVHGSILSALRAFQTLHASPRRFVTALPEWESIARRVAFQYPATQHLVEFLRRHGPLPLNELTWLLWTREPRLAVDVFLRPSVCEQYSDSVASTPPWDALDSPESYRPQAVFQFKATLFHSGILESRGSCSTHLTPTSDVWELDE